MPPKIDPKAAADATNSPGSAGGGVPTYNCMVLKYVCARKRDLPTKKEDLGGFASIGATAAVKPSATR